MIAIRILNLTKIFRDRTRDVHAVDDISFTIDAGEIFGILGPNGAGKTTLFRLIAGLYEPTFGKVELNGRNVKDWGDRIRQQIGFLTENHGNYETLTIEENLRFFGSFYNIPNLSEKIDSILLSFGLEDRKKMVVGKLSKGLKQRVALARILLPDSPFLFLDEPTSGLDPQAAVEVRNIIKGLKNEKRTIIINSHNLEEVQKVCDRVSIINKGKIVQIGTATQLSRDLFVKQELSVKVKDSITPDIAPTLQNLSFVENVNVMDNILTLHVKNLDENTPEIMEFLFKHNMKVLEVSRKTHSLEDIYLALMANNQISM